MSKKFLRTAIHRKVRIGKGRRKKQVWRRARGRHNKTRENKKGRPAKVQIGYGTKADERGKINGKVVKFIRNFNDLSDVVKEDLVIIASLGNKKRLEIEKKINEIGAEILNGRKNESK